MTAIAERLRETMEEKGMTYGQLSQLTGIVKSALHRYVNGDTDKIPLERLEAMAKALNVSPAYLMCWTDDKNFTRKVVDKIPYQPTGMAPILGSIPCGYPALAEQDIIGYETIEKPHPEEYYYLMVSGDSMIGAGLLPGDLALIHKQSYAEPGQIVACRVNGDEATLKRYREQDGMVILMPENNAYNPVIVKATDFASGDAAILGVLVELKRKY